MDGVTTGIIVFEGIMFLAVIGVLIYLVVRRIEERSNETFEQREN